MLASMFSFITFRRVTLLLLISFMTKWCLMLIGLQRWKSQAGLISTHSIVLLLSSTISYDSCEILSLKNTCFSHNTFLHTSESALYSTSDKLSTTLLAGWSSYIYILVLSETHLYTYSSFSICTLFAIPIDIYAYTKMDKLSCFYDESELFVLLRYVNIILTATNWQRSGSETNKPNVMAAKDIFDLAFSVM